MDSDFVEDNDVIRKIKAMPHAPLPPDFTKKVMGRLPELDYGIANRLRGYLLGLAVLDTGKNESINKASCSFYYFMTAVFYLIIGIVSFVGLKNIGGGMGQTDWIAMQPVFTLGMALWLFLLGILLLATRSLGVKAAKYGTIIYIVAAVVNTLLLQPYLHMPYAVCFISGLAITSAIMGIMLIQAVRKMPVEKTI